MTTAGPERRSAEEQFGEHAAKYRNSRTHVGGENLEIVERYVAKDGRYYNYGVDIATGAGFTAFAIAPFTDTVVATDLTSQMLEQVKAIREERGVTNVERTRVAAEWLPFKDASLDLLTCRTAPHHFLDVSAWLSEVSRVLRPGGVFVLADTTSPEEPEVADWMNDVELRRDLSHIWNLSPSQWRTAVEKVGLEVTDWELCPVHLEFYDWTQRSGMPEADMLKLRNDFQSASPEVKAAFHIQPEANGEFWFYWDAVIIRAVKPAA